MRCCEVKGESKSVQRVLEVVYRWFTSQSVRERLDAVKCRDRGLVESVGPENERL